MIPNCHDSIFHLGNAVSVSPDSFAVIDLQAIDHLVCQSPNSSDLFSVIKFFLSQTFLQGAKSTSHALLDMSNTFKFFYGFLTINFIFL